MLWGSTNALSSILFGIDMVSKGEANRSFYTRRGIAFLIVITFGFLAGLLLILLVLSNSLVTIIGTTYGSIRLVGYLQWPVSSIVTFFAATVLYIIAPNIRPRLSSIVYGALFFACTWQLFTYLFTLYIQRVGSYSLTFGMLGTILVTMVYFYLSAFLLLIGGEINYLMEDRQPRRYTS